MRKHSNRSVWSIHALRSDIQTRGELDQTEREFIGFLRAQNPEYGYNICEGGEGIGSKQAKELWSNHEYRTRQTKERRERWTYEHRTQHSKRMKQSRSVIEPLVQRNRTPISAERRQNLQASHTGLKRSKESRVKQGLSISGVRNHMYGKHHSGMHYRMNCGKHGRVEVPTPSSDCPRCKSERAIRITGMLRAGMVPYEIAKELGVSQRRILRWIRESRTF